MTCGIYIISFCGRNRIYIGQSKHIQRRWEEHTTDLENDRHANVKMTSLWRKFGNTMRFHVLKECSIERLDKEEQLLIDVLFENYKENAINIQRSVKDASRFPRFKNEANAALMAARFKKKKTQ
jgi:group I intron endonuclease